MGEQNKNGRLSREELNTLKDLYLRFMRHHINPLSDFEVGVVKGAYASIATHPDLDEG